jgi:hypothetical protein
MESQEANSRDQSLDYLRNLLLPYPELHFSWRKQSSQTNKKKMVFIPYKINLLKSTPEVSSSGLKNKQRQGTIIRFCCFTGVVSYAQQDAQFTQPRF